MGKIKQFVEDHKSELIGSVAGAGLATLGIVAYNVGFNKGCKTTSLLWAAMINADRDGTMMLVEKHLGDLCDDKDFIAWGNDVLRKVSE